MRSLVVLSVLVALAPVARADRPAQVGFGLGASVETTPVGTRALAAPISIELGGEVVAPLWWRVTASFGSASLADDHGDGYQFALRTGPAVERCWGGTVCAGASAALGWGHARWTMMDAAPSITRDGVDVDARASLAVAIDPGRRVFLAGVAGPTLHYAVRTDDPGRQVTGDRTDLGLLLGVALVIRN